MNSFGKIWVFYDRKKKKKSKALTLVQAQSTILSLLNKDPGRYYIWTPGWSEWAPLDKFLSSEQTYFMLTPEVNQVVKSIDDLTMKTDDIDDDLTVSINELTETITKMIYTQVAAELPAKSSDYGYYHPDFNADDLDIKLKIPAPTSDIGKRNVSEKDRRIEIRHNFKMEIIVVSKKGKTFKTFSDNLSLGGTLLQDPLPREFLNAPFDLIFINRFEQDPTKGRLYFNGKVVGDVKEPRRLMFLNPDPQSVKRLESMIQAYISYQNSMQKKSG